MKATILNHPEFTAFAARSRSLYTDWCQVHAARLKGIAVGDQPKALIHTIAEDLLARFAQADLIPPGLLGGALFRG